MKISFLTSLSLGILSLSAIFFSAASPSEKEIGGIYQIPTGKGTVEIEPLTDNIFRVTSFPTGEKLNYKPSQSAILSPQKVDIKTTETPDAFVIYSPTTSVRVNWESGQVTFHDAAGNLILSETEGVNNSNPVKSVAFEGTSSEKFFGGGERGHSLDLNGDTLTFYNRQNYGYTGSDSRISQMGISVPYIVSDAGYGILFDDYNEAIMTLGDTIQYISNTPLPLSYYFINGEGSVANTTKGYTQLTGRQSLPPFWSLGYITSKYGYHTQDEANGVIDTLKNKGYPVDGIVLDLYWYGKETDMGRLEWNPQQWPDHKQMLADLKDKGVNMVLITQPYINKIGALDNYNLLSKAGMLVKDSLGNTHDVTTWVGEAGMFDVSNPATREWLWNRLKDLTAEGVAGWWGDLGEPEVHPRTIRHDNGQTASQYHNVYGNEWSRIIYDGLRKDFPDMRPLLMMRGGTAGLQRYSVFPWTTDVSRSWGGLEPQVNLMLSSGLSGLAYMSSDLGGFAVDPENPLDEELYVRWVQMGAFTPSMRTHAQLQPEPYHYPGSENILKEYVKMRYKWLPYNYTLAYENATKGWPLARPVSFHNPGFQTVKNEMTSEYLWGENVLVAPVFTQGATKRTVDFPEGKWYSWYDAQESYTGPSSEEVPAPLGRLPLFVKGGAFIPQYDMPIQNVTEYDPTFLTVRYYPSENHTTYTLFDDNRMSPTSLEDNDYQLAIFDGEKKGDAISVMIYAKGEYDGMPESRMITMELMDVDKPKNIKISDGARMDEFQSLKMIRQYGWYYDNASRILYVRFPWAYQQLRFIVE